MRIELVNRSVTFNTKVTFRHLRATNQTGHSPVAYLGVYFYGHVVVIALDEQSIIQIVQK
jgi:hypothetical protein